MKHCLILLALSATLATSCDRGAPVRGDEATALLARADSIDSLAKRHHVSERIFAIVNERLVPVADTARWPEDTEGEIRVLFQDGRPLRHVEIPVSHSGDWYATHSHYFDTTGRTIVTDDYVGFILDGCGGSGSITRRTAYGRRFTPLRTGTRHADAEGRTRAGEACGGRTDLLQGNALASYDDLVRAGRAPAR